MSTYPVSIIGFGKIAKTHEQAIAQHPNLVLDSVVDPYVANSNHKTYTSLTDFLANNKTTKLVAITTPNGLHYSQAKQCLEAGKHVLVEKPITLNSQQANNLLQIAKQQQLRLFCAMQLRLSPAVMAIKQLLNQQKLGKVFMVNVQCYWNRNKDYYLTKPWHGTKEMDGGVLFTQFSHFIDVLNYWFDDVQPTNAQFYNFTHQACTEFADSGKIDFTANNAFGNMIFTTSAYPKNFESSISIIAQNGTIKVSNQYLNNLSYFQVKDTEAPLIHEPETNFHPHLYQELYEAIGKQRSSVLDAKHAIKLVDFIERSEALALNLQHF